MAKMSETLLEARLGQFDSISLEEMGKVKLMNRVDTKYLTTFPTLLKLLELASADYYVQEIGGKRNMPYATLTKNHHKHINREYVGSDAKFLEVKSKNNKGRTKKKRVALGPDNSALRANDEFLSRHTPWTSLHLLPRLQNSFKRITLVNRNMTERLTIDTSLCFHNMSTDLDRSLEGLVIIELKRDGLTPSPILGLLNRLRIKPHGFSKYCMGMAFTDSGLRQNRLKERLRNADRLCREARAELS